jgi:formamidopyrimidine-DNA glycosylase
MARERWTQQTMPELPEVETVRRGLVPLMVGQRIARVEARRPDLRFPLPDQFNARAAGQTVDSLERRAKYLIARLSGGDALVMHLGMSGRFSIVRARAAQAAHETLGAYIYDTGADPKHDHVVIHFDDGVRVVYNDPRRFGFMLLIPQAELAGHALFHKLGAEPLGADMSAEYLATRARGKAVNLKSLLMDQRVIAGLGNIYVSEALHRAQLSPNRKARSLADRRGAPTERAIRLVPAIQSVLEQAIRAGGSSLRDYRQADGSTGAFQEAFAVYDRAGAACVRPGCGGTIQHAVHTGRSTYYCSRCQR